MRLVNCILKRAGINRPISIRYGIMCFEFFDRRLIGLNEWKYD